jgi:hypothetical protein
LSKHPRPNVDHQRGKEFVEREVSQGFDGANPRDRRAIVAGRSKKPRSPI